MIFNLNKNFIIIKIINRFKRNINWIINKVIIKLYIIYNNNKWYLFIQKNTIIVNKLIIYMSPELFINWLNIKKYWLIKIKYISIDF